MTMKSTCPICGGIGEDLLFAFYCTHSDCQNFNVKALPEVNSAISITQDITLILNRLWKVLGVGGEDEESFLIRFFGMGGRFNLKDRQVQIKLPQYLRARAQERGYTLDPETGLPAKNGKLITEVLR